MTRYDTEMYTDECTRRNLGMLEQAQVCRPLDEVRALVFANHIMNRWKCVLLNMRGGYELCSIFFRFTIQSVNMTNDSWNHFQDKRTHFKLLFNEINQLFSFATISLNLSLARSHSKTIRTLFVKSQIIAIIGFHTIRQH